MSISRNLPAKLHSTDDRPGTSTTPSSKRAATSSSTIGKELSGTIAEGSHSALHDVMDLSDCPQGSSSFKSGLLCDQAPKNAASTARGVQLSALQGAPLGPIFAAIDLGSSSAKMLVQRFHADGRIETLSDLKIGCALGKNVDNGSAIPKENQNRTKDALQTLLDEAARFGVSPENVPLITTAVMRNASNGVDFLAVLQGELGISRARILSGDDEAAIGFRGAISAFTKDAASDAPFASIDLGGGSFQMAVGTPAGVEKGASTQVGSNHILDNLLTDYVGYDEAIATFGDADFSRTDVALSDEAPMPMPATLLEGRQLVATGGVSKFLAVHLGHNVVTASEIDELRRRIGQMPVGERGAFLRQGKDENQQRALGLDTPEKAVGYARKLPASLSLLHHILQSLGLPEVSVSSSDARHALVQNMADSAQKEP